MMIYGASKGKREPRTLVRMAPFPYGNNDEYMNTKVLVLMRRQN